MARKTPTNTPGETPETDGTTPEKPKATPRAKAPAKPAEKVAEAKPARTPRRKPVPAPPTEEEATGKVETKAPNTPPPPEDPETPEVPEVNETLGGQTATTANLGERLLDTVFGFGVINAEVIEKAATRLGEVITDLPTYLAEVEAKGRPLREQLFGSMKFDFPTSEDVFEMAEDADETGGTGGTGESTEPTTSTTPSTESTAKSESPAPPKEPAKPKAVARPAEDEISALERRVRELEQQVDTDYDMEK
jgi:hypothetical protein